MSWLWRWIDRILIKIYRIKPINPGSDIILSVEIKRYHGRKLTLRDHTILSKGDCFLAIHLNRQWFLNRRFLENQSGWTWTVINALERDLVTLSRQIKSGAYGNVVALQSVTFLAAGMKRLGFEICDLPPCPGRWWQDYYQHRLMVTYYLPRTTKVRSIKTPLKLKEAWLSIPASFKKYLADE